MNIVPDSCSLLFREQPIYTTRAHVFQIDPTTKKNWVPASKQAVTVSYFYDSTRNSYRIISVDGFKVCVWLQMHRCISILSLPARDAGIMLNIPMTYSHLFQLYERVHCVSMVTSLLCKNTTKAWTGIPLLTVPGDQHLQSQTDYLLRWSLCRLIYMLMFIHQHLCVCVKAQHWHCQSINSSMDRTETQDRHG